MSTPAQLAAEMEALLAYETSSNDEFYECNSDAEGAEGAAGAAAQEDAPEALDGAQPSEEAAEAQEQGHAIPFALPPREEAAEQGPVIPFALPPSDTMFHSLEEAWEFLDRWTGPRGYGLRIHRRGRLHVNGEINQIYLVCDRANPRNRKKSASHVVHRYKGTLTRNCHFRMVLKRSMEGSPWRLIYTHQEHSHEPS
ncbi:hypothetical protein PV08_01072 [Exophiala spinifera]|uniref:FAR1 domain-containing protein n=1 Tax=Exophiala spinifera TaxID=91928 RepID=A0A0D2A6W9_9EURO|nr:uncharacterized protein PV08_01072 [Exophiala spinifera]KIW20497.1 hypothetical protein PV08_01072 [Exophiala spinifera]